MATGSRKEKATALSRDEETTKLLLSARGYKGHLMRQLNAIKRAQSAFSRTPSDFAAQELLAAVKHAERTMASLQGKMQESMEASSRRVNARTHASGDAGVAGPIP